MATTVSLKPNAVEISGSTSGTTTLQATAVAGTTTLTLPAATDTLVGKATTDTLTNKTLTSPTLTTPVLGTPSSGTLTNCSGLPASTGITGTLGIANGGTGLATNPPMFSAYSVSTQTPASATATKVIFGTESFDTNSNFASSRFTATIAGYYQFSACASCSADTSLTKVLLQFYKNGAAQVDIVATSLSSATSLSTDAPSAFSTSSLVYLAATDYVEVYATVTGTGGNRYIFASNAGYPTVFTGALIR